MYGIEVEELGKATAVGAWGEFDAFSLQGHQLSFENPSPGVLASVRALGLSNKSNLGGGPDREEPPVFSDARTPGSPATPNEPRAARLFPPPRPPKPGDKMWYERAKPCRMQPHQTGARQDPARGTTVRRNNIR